MVLKQQYMQFEAYSKAVLHYVSVIYPIISTYVSKCYNMPAWLYIIGGTGILSKWGTTQGNPTVMAAYTLGVTSLIHHLLEITSSSKLYSKEIAYANDFTVAGSIKDTKYYWEHLNSFATFFGYYLKASKPHLIIKSQYLETANVVFRCTKISLKLESIQHLGAVIKSHLYKEKYVCQLVTIINYNSCQKWQRASHNQHFFKK